jgi:hypothetical protein
MYAAYLILRTQADSHRIPINTELTEQKRSTPAAAERRGIQNEGVSTCTIGVIYRFVCVCARFFVLRIPRIYAQLSEK